MVSDEALYEKLLQGDMTAFDILYGRYERPLFGFVCRYLDDRNEAEDVLHETFIAVLKDRSSASATRSLRAWLFQVARNLCLNRARSRHRAARAIEVEARTPLRPEPQAQHQLESREALEALARAVARLPEPLSEVYRLRAAGLSYDEMSTVLAIPLGTVKSRIHEMVDRLREEAKSWTAA